jgi:hypothetical protein
VRVNNERMTFVADIGSWFEHQRTAAPTTDDDTERRFALTRVEGHRRPPRSVDGTLDPFVAAHSGRL